MKIKALSSTRPGPDFSKLPESNIPVDYPWKILGWLTDDLVDYLEESDERELRHIIVNRDVAALLSFSEVNGLQSMSRLQGDVPKVRALYLLSSLLKKYRFETKKEARIQAALCKFREYEEKCNSYNLEGYKEFSGGSTIWANSVFFYAKRFLSGLLGAPGHQELTEWSRHGPGTSVGMLKGEVSSYFKYSRWPYTVTEGAVRYARFAIETDRRWYGALQNDYRARFNIPKQYPITMEVFWKNVLEVVNGNRITFVPKNAKIERSIAIEPTMNLYLQLGVDGYIRRRLKRWGVDLDNQEKNQLLARMGSVREDDKSLITLDLAGASDSVSTQLCKMLLPPHWYAFLMDLRSPQGDLDGEILDYQKISSMGNGYTFVLESAIFTALIYAVYKADGVRLTDRNFAVYGDDLIVEKRFLFKLGEALRLSGFSLNMEKSFAANNLRESCGTDWFNGKPVRPVFLENTPLTVGQLWNDFNRLQRLFDLYWGARETKTLSNIEKWIPEFFRDFTGPCSDEEFDTYKHCREPNGKYKNCLWHYKRLITKPIKRKGDNFLFRKLMHNLRPSHVPCKWDAKTGGSRFNVVMRDHNALCKSSATASDWRSTYSLPY